MQLEQIEARMQRLNELAMKLMEERDRWRRDMQVLHGHEREAYNKALTEAIRGLEGARIALAAALFRITSAGGWPPCPGGRSQT